MAIDDNVQPDSQSRHVHAPDTNSVRVCAGEVLSLMMHAARTNRTWLSDFSEETIEVSRDMYDVLLAYKRIAFQENSQELQRRAA